MATPFTYSIQGASGFSGTQGPQGAQGSTGQAGQTGAQGATGPQGFTGLQGAQGISGYSGVNGLNGAQGATGAQGTNGTVGSNGAQGATGAQGAAGSNGAQGATGAQGAAGSNGAQGAAGSNGVQGAQGSTGAQGAQGATGSGAQGATGATGTSGYSGQLGANTTVYVQSGTVNGVPSAVGSGNLWYNTDTGALNIWISSSSSWVVAVPYVDPSTIFRTSGGTITGNVGMSGNLAVTGSITATSSITANYSDKRLKDIKGNIANALAKVLAINGISYLPNDLAKQYGYSSTKPEVGVIAQELEVVLPEVVVPAPFDIGTREDGTTYSKSGENYIAVQYERIIPLLIEAIKEQQAQINELRALIKPKE